MTRSFVPGWIRRNRARGAAGRGTVNTIVWLARSSGFPAEPAWSHLRFGRAVHDRVRKARPHDDVGANDRRIGHELHARPVDQRVVVGAGEDQGAVGQLRGEGRTELAERGHVSGVQMDGVAVRNEGTVARGEAFRLHRTLDPSLELDRLEPGPEDPRRGALEEAFEEPLEGGQRGHDRGRL